MKKKIGFIYFDEIHHIHHFLGSFIELYTRKEYDVEIITYLGNNHEYLYYLLELHKIPISVLRKVRPFRYRQLLNIIRRRKRPSIHFLFKHNRNILSQYDVLIYNSARQKYMIEYRGKKDLPKLAYLDHGAGDGDYVYNDKITNFDLVTVAGKKVYDMCINSADFSNVNIKICGYQKFDTVKKESKNVKLFNNDNPIVLYNPHFRKQLTSFYKKGEDILDFFYNNKNYNLIFAPHLILYNRKGHLTKESFNSKYLNRDNIHVDLGSVNSVNMRYTMLSDIYLGDVSSQVYEFLIKPRPCIFINAHNVDWENNKYYANWKLGKVIDDVSKLGEVLDNSTKWQKDYLNKQVDIIDYTYFSDKNKTASKIIADEIVKLL